MHLCRLLGAAAAVPVLLPDGGSIACFAPQPYAALPSLQGLTSEKKAAELGRREAKAQLAAANRQASSLCQRSVHGSLPCCS